jgi:hypothetical protein
MTVRGGRCACGAVSYTVDAEMRPVAFCHCHRCRRFTGHHMAGAGAATASVTITGQDAVRWWSPDPTVAYGFCGTCGSSLFWRSAERPDLMSICAGTLDQPTGLTTVASWWTVEHGDYFPRTPGLVEHDYDG